MNGLVYDFKILQINKITDKDIQYVRKFINNLSCMNVYTCICIYILIENLSWL